MATQALSIDRLPSIADSPAAEMDIRDLPINLMMPRPDARPLDDATVKGLAGSIEERGLHYAIQVRKIGPFWEIIAGNHRVAAFKLLGRTTIPSRVFDLDDDQAELAMIDENLIRIELTVLDKALAMRRRKVLHEKLHPEATAGRVRARGANKSMGRNVAANLAPTFTAETAARTGLSEREVQRQAKRGAGAESLGPEVVAAIRGTHLEDNGVFLDEVIATPKEHRLALARERLGGKKSKGTGHNNQIWVAYQHASFEVQRQFIDLLAESLG